MPSTMRATRPFPLLAITIRAILCTSLVSAQFDFGDFGDFGQMNNQRCKPYTCEKGYEPVPKKKHEYKSAGCNAMGGGGMSLFGDEEDEKPYETCCHQFHACYQICGSVKRECDSDYKKCTETKCNETEDPEQCMESVKMNSMMLQLAGCKQHEVEQNKHCNCVTKYGDKHLQAREESLRQFYRLNAPDSVGKAKDLIKKADTAPKLAKLLIKLVKKYPDAIEIVEDPQSRIYRSVFGNAGFGGGDDGDDEDGDEAGGGRKVEYEEEEIEDFDVDEDLGGYGEEEEEEEEEAEQDDAEELLRQAEELRKKAEKLKAEKAKKKKKKETPPPPPPPPEEEKEEEHDEFNQYEEL